ncbi:MAG: RNA 2',3'-cyclic phosphodiesterase [Saccharofermentanales bacterium]
MDDKPLRLFTAIELPPDWIRAAEKRAGILKRAGVKGRFTPSDRLHLTVNFLGECPLLQEVMGTLEALKGQPAPRLVLDRPGFFKRREGGHILVWHLEQDARLLDYQRKEADLLARLGLRLDGRPYKPHLTLARQVFHAPENLQDLLPPPQPFTAREVVLFSSEFEDRRLIYQPLARWPFAFD